ncbi:MAG: hypothetical protein M1433_00385 [Candidatus Parvarchaeota archaeon]|nr:hypothetical protein [Candidatus Parvarchaeota archaeon]
MIPINAEYVLFAGALLIILADFLRITLHIHDRKIIHYLTLTVLIVSFAAEVLLGNMNIAFFSSTQYSGFVNGFVLFIASAIYVFLLADTKDHSVFIDFLFLFATLGALLVVLSSNFISLILAIEMISIASYGLVFFHKTDRQMEGAMKYVSISFLSILIVIFGSSLIYGGTGSLAFSATSVKNYLPFIAGIALVLAGLAFKSTIVPFHMWAPDVYETSDGTVTAFLSSVSKTAGLVAMIRVFFFALPVSSNFVMVMFVSLAIATIFFASFMAVVQEKIKRILAYSSIAQAGFAFVAIALLDYVGVHAAIFYVFSFAVADALVFLAYKLFEDNNIIYKKDAKKMFPMSKVGTIGLFVGLLSLAGLPPTIGFFGKLLVFQALLVHGYVYLVVALFAIILFSTFYYFGLIREMELSKVNNSLRRYGANMHVKEGVIIVLTLALFVGVVFVSL